MDLSPAFMWTRRSGSTCRALSLRGYYAYNLLEELDQPGEWYLDRSTGTLYLYPPPAFDKSQIEVSMLETPFIQILNTRHLSFENIEFNTARGMGIYLENAQHISIKNCRFSKLGTVAISCGQPLLDSPQAYALERLTQAEPLGIAGVQSYSYSKL